MNKYERWYAAICARGAERRSLGSRKVVGFEDHHILPRSMGGSNRSDNIARLTPQEHYLAHMLLWKIHAGNRAMQHAFWMMSNRVTGVRVRGRAFARIRAQIAEKQAAAIRGNSMRTGKLHSAEARAKMSASRPDKKPVTNCAGMSFGCVLDAVKRLHAEGFPKATSFAVSASCKGTREKAYGYTWRYAEK